MSTTSTVSTVRSALITSFEAELSGVPVFRSWPGPEAAPEMIVFGSVDWDTYEIATIKAGRKHRQEEYGIEFELYVFGEPGSSPADPAAAEDRALALLAAMENALADDVTGGTDFATVQSVQLGPPRLDLRVFENNWACRISGQVDVRARLR